MRATAIVTTLIFAMGVAGCSGGGEAGPSALATSADNVFHDQLYWAERADASEKQLEALAEASRTGEMSFETVSELVEDMFACLEEAGIGYARMEPERVGPDFLIPTYRINGTASGMTPAQAEAVGSECIEKNSYFAEGAYQIAPQAVAARDEVIRSQLPQIVECLNSNGVAATEDETLDELTRKVIDLVSETSQATDGEGVVSCSWDMVTRGASP